MEPEGILKGAIINVRMIKANPTAQRNDSMFSRQAERCGVGGEVRVAAIVSDFQDREKRFLRNFDIAKLLHAFLPFPLTFP